MKLSSFDFNKIFNEVLIVQSIYHKKFDTSKFSSCVIIINNDGMEESNFETEYSWKNEKCVFLVDNIIFIVFDFFKKQR